MSLRKLGKQAWLISGSVKWCIANELFHSAELRSRFSFPGFRGSAPPPTLPHSAHARFSWPLRRSLGSLRRGKNKTSRRFFKVPFDFDPINRSLGPSKKKKKRTSGANSFSTGFLKFAYGKNVNRPLPANSPRGRYSCVFDGRRHISRKSVTFISYDSQS